MENITEVKKMLSIPKDIVITSHRNPDGDAIGSSLGLYHYLCSLGHTVRIVLPSEYPPSFSWMPAIKNIVIYDLDAVASDYLLRNADIIFALDYNALDRIDKMGEIINGLPKTVKILIDHHLDPEPFADYVLSEITASSTSELIYDFIDKLGDRESITLEIAECLYTGIITDTGSFRYAVSPKLYYACAELLRIGVDVPKLQDLIFNSLQEKHLRLLGHALAHRMEVLPEFETAIIYLDKKDYEVFDIQRGDTEGIVNQMLMLKNIKIAAFITEQPNIVKISMRSKGDFSVQEICRNHFKGGGHKNASGGHSHNSLRATIQKLKEVLPLYFK